VHLVVLIPAYNEQNTIADVIRSIPDTISGISNRTVLVVDDGSEDRTAAQARSAGADQVILHPWNKGLAETFRTGRTEALRRDVDIFVTLDSDGQYDSREIALLVQPILEGHADMVVGERDVSRLSHMPHGNKIGNMIGSSMLRVLLGVPVRDASSGFRAFSRVALEQMDIESRHTYTHETLMRAHAKRMRIHSVPIHFHERAYGKSKLVRTLSNHIARSVGTIIRCMLTVDPLRTFMRIGALVVLMGTALAALSLVVGQMNTPFIKLTAILIVFVGLQVVLLGCVAEIMRKRGEVQV